MEPMESTADEMNWTDRLSHDVLLPIERVPEFPKRCIVCNKADVETTIRLKAFPDGRNGIGKWLLGLGKRQDIPACNDHGSRLRWQTRWRTMAPVTVTVISIIAIIYVNSAVIPDGHELGKIPAVILGLLPAVAIVLYGIFNPLAFEFQKDSEKGVRFIRYQFKSLDYAREFAEINLAEVQDLADD